MVAVIGTQQPTMAVDGTHDRKVFVRRRLMRSKESNTRYLGQGEDRSLSGKGKRMAWRRERIGRESVSSTNVTWTTTYEN